MGLIKRILFKRVSLPVFIISVVVGFYAIKYTYLYIIVYPAYRTSYIQSIYSEYYSNLELKTILDDFNRMGYTKIVHYEGIRPIFITDGKLEYPTIGSAWTTVSWGYIKLAPRLDKTLLRLVLIHEYLHIFGYDHTKKYQDLMFSELDKSNPPSEENIKQYARELCIFLNGKNECQ